MHALGTRRYLLSARRAQILVGTLLQDSPAMDDILRDCVLIPMPASFSHLVPDIAKYVEAIVNAVAAIASDTNSEWC